MIPNKYNGKQTRLRMHVIVNENDGGDEIRSSVYILKSYLMCVVRGCMHSH